MKGRLKVGDVVGVRNANTIEEAKIGLKRDWPGCTFNVVIPDMKTRYDFIAEVIESDWAEEEAE